MTEPFVFVMETQTTICLLNSQVTCRPNSTPKIDQIYLGIFNAYVYCDYTLNTTKSRTWNFRCRIFKPTATVNASCSWTLMWYDILDMNICNCRNIFIISIYQKSGKFVQSFTVIQSCDVPNADTAVPIMGPNCQKNLYGVSSTGMAVMVKSRANAVVHVLSCLCPIKYAHGFAAFKFAVVVLRVHNEQVTYTSGKYHGLTPVLKDPCWIAGLIIQWSIVHCETSQKRTIAQIWKFVFEKI